MSGQQVVSGSGSVWLQLSLMKAAVCGYFNKNPVS